MVPRKQIIIFYPVMQIQSTQDVEAIEIQLAEESACCYGANGRVEEVYPDFVICIALERVEEAKITGTEAMIAACPQCEIDFPSLDELEAILSVITSRACEAGNLVKKEVKMALSGNVYRELEDIVGPENISEDPSVIDTYSFRRVTCTT